jgi:DNA-binding transcriptional regulator YhcF (GntR family)
MGIDLDLHVDVRSPLPIRQQLTEQLKHVIEGGGVPPDQALPSIRELANFLGINPNTVARVIEDLKRSGYVEARRGTGVFVSPAPPARPSPHLRTAFLRDVVIQAAALGMTAHDLAVGVLSLPGGRPAAIQEAVEILLVECSLPELDFVARQLEAHLPVRVEPALIGELAPLVQRRPRARRWRAAVTSFAHLPEVERLLSGQGVPVIALLAEAHLETLHRLAQLPSGTRVGVATAAAETAHNLEHSIASAGLPNIALVGACRVEGPELGRLLRRVDVVVCSSAAAGRIRGVAGPAVHLMLDDRVLHPRAIEMLATLLVHPNGDATTGSASSVRRGPGPRGTRRRPPRATPATAKRSRPSDRRPSTRKTS